ncbi:TraM recognition domain-containing protein [Cellulomonas sp. ES6]|uniref:type IV secretory system conjugative DNA transfer family protein n=1 Tax=Cellulomonas sp. ES6 TaxID=3039384 RepID=UPI0024B7095C|nr:TraM recognition domain-containing protein [Cellulomonas sp. ES6]WHP16597.1 TraM recognition domain-containing protein [Cellulomonas sp. ES6]
MSTMTLPENAEQLTAKVRAVGRRISRGPVARALRRHTNAYRVLVDLDDKTITGVIGAGALVWLAGLVVTGSVGVHPVARTIGGALTLVCWLVGSTCLLVWWVRYRLSATRQRHDLLSRPGMARAREIETTVGPSAVLERGKRVRPTLAATGKLTATDVAWRLGTSRTVDVMVSSEQPVYLVGPARSGKGLGVLIASIAEAPGAVVATSTRADNMAATIGLRAATGPVLVFDPERVSHRATTIKWPPFARCEDPAIAQRRAATLVSRTGLSGENQVWATSAGGIVQALLHAAAIGHRSIHDLHRWSKSPLQAAEAMQILERESAAGWDRTIEAVRGDDPRMRSNKWFGVETAFASLDVPAVREMFDVDPRDPDAFDPRAFLAEAGTLYPISRWRDSASVGASVGGFMSMLLDTIAEAVREAAQTSPAGRAEPPVTMVLDEIANIHPWPALPQAMAAGSGEGLQVVVAFQSRAQARDAYGDDAEQSMWDNAVRVLLGGSMDEPHLRELSAMLGERTVKQTSRSWSTQTTTSMSEQPHMVPLVSAAELRRLPEDLALAVAGRTRPIAVDLVNWPQRPWAEQVRASLAWHQEHPVVPGQVAPSYPVRAQ